MKQFELITFGDRNNVVVQNYEYSSSPRLVARNSPAKCFGYVYSVVLSAAKLPVRDAWSATHATRCNPTIVTEQDQRRCGLILHHDSDIVSIDAETMQQRDTELTHTITQLIKGVVPPAEQTTIVLNFAELLCEQPKELAA